MYKERLHRAVSRQRPQLLKCEVSGLVRKVGGIAELWTPFDHLRALKLLHMCTLGPFHGVVVISAVLPVFTRCTIAATHRVYIISIGNGAC